MSFTTTHTLAARWAAFNEIIAFAANPCFSNIVQKVQFVWRQMWYDVRLVDRSPRGGNVFVQIGSKFGISDSVHNECIHSKTIRTGEDGDDSSDLSLSRRACTSNTGWLTSCSSYLGCPNVQTLKPETDGSAMGGWLSEGREGRGRLLFAGKNRTHTERRYRSHKGSPTLLLGDSVTLVDIPDSHRLLPTETVANNKYRQLGKLPNQLRQRCHERNREICGHRRSEVSNEHVRVRASVPSYACKNPE